MQMKKKSGQEPLVTANVPSQSTTWMRSGANIFLAPSTIAKKDTDDKTIPRKYEVLFLLFPFVLISPVVQAWTSIHILSWWWFIMFHWIGTNLAGTSYAYDHALVHTKLGSFKIRWPDDHGSSVMQYRQKKSFWICICLVDHSKWS